jgi:isoleucyl-tRNA synthetase
MIRRYTGPMRETLMNGEFLSIDPDLIEDITYLEGSDQHRGWFQSSLLTSGK